MIKKIIIGILIVILGLVIFSFVSNLNPTQPDVNWNNSWNKALQSAVDSYQGCPDGWEDKIMEKPYLPKKMYCNRPELPTNFGDINVFFQLGTINNLSRIGPEYYDQPEFFPNFETQVIKVLQEYNPNRFGLTVPEIYPLGRVFQNVQPGMALKGETLVRTGPLGTKYMHVDLDLVYPEEFYWASDKNSQKLSQPDNADEYFDVELSRNRMLFKPSFPVWPKNWTQKIIMEVKVKEGTPKGKYAIGIKFDSINDQKLIEDSIFKYGTLYQTTMFMVPSEPWYTIFIEVVE